MKKRQVSAVQFPKGDFSTKWCRTRTKTSDANPPAKKTQDTSALGGLYPALRYEPYGLVTVLLAKVTALVSAAARPFSVAPVFSVTEAWAMMVPLKTEVVPRVAELPTCQ